MISGYQKPFRLDRNDQGGGILVYVRNCIPAKVIKNINLPSNTETIFFDIVLGKKKWLISASYNPSKLTISYHLGILGNIIDRLIQKYDNLLFIGDYNAEVKEEPLQNFILNYNLKCLIKEPTCFKSINAPSTIDLFLTNKHKSFIHSTTLETGLFDHHKMILTILNSNFIKCKSKKVFYRSYRNFDSVAFRYHLGEMVTNINHPNTTLQQFRDGVINVLNDHAPLKQILIRGNNQPFMTKELRKAIMERSRLRNIYLQYPTPGNKRAYSAKRNSCVKLLKNTKKRYYENLDTNLIRDSRSFWKTVKPLFSDKCIVQQDISLLENNTLITEDKLVADIFNHFFSNIVPNLHIKENEDILINSNTIENPINKAILKFSYHPSIMKIKDNVKVNSSEIFKFNIVSEDDIENILLNLDTSKATSSNSIPCLILRDNKDIFIPVITKIFNDSVLNQAYPEDPKLADVIPAHKKDELTDKCNYRPISLLPTLSKIYERIYHLQINMYMEGVFSKQLCGFRKGHSTQHCLLVMLEKIRNTLDNKGACALLLTDLSKAFDCIRHDLLIAKLHSYGFDGNALQLMFSYMSNRRHVVIQRTITSYNVRLRHTAFDYAIQRSITSYSV